MTGANRQLHRQNSQNPQSLIDTVGPHADKKTTLAKKRLDPVNQIALAIEKLANKTLTNPFFTPKTH